MSFAVALPEFVKAKTCLLEICAPANLSPLVTPACSISQAAEVLILPSLCGQRGASAGNLSASSLLKIGLIKNEPAERIC